MFEGERKNESTALIHLVMYVLVVASRKDTLTRWTEIMNQSGKWNVLYYASHNFQGLMVL